MKGSAVLIVWLFFLISATASAQTKFTLNGYVKDSLSGESVIGATVAIDGKSVTSNQYGFYSITVDSGSYQLTVSHVSFLTFAQPVQLLQNREQNIFLVPRSAALNEVVVFSRRRDANVRNAQMGKIDLSMNQIRGVPALWERWTY